MAGDFSKLLDQHGRPVASSYDYYQGIGYGRERRYLPVVAGDSNQTLTQSTRTQLLAFGRFLVANVGLARAAVQDKATYSIGSGLLPQSQAVDPKARALYETFFNKVWAPQCDLTGRHSFGQMQHLLCQAVDVDGDIGCLQYAPDRRSLGQLQVVEGHRITSEDRNEGYSDGLKLDAFGRTMAYRVKEGPKEYRDIPAQDFIFLFDPDRCDAGRGQSGFVHAIAHFRDILDIISYEKVGVKMASAIGVAIKTETGAVDRGTSYIKSGFTAIDTGGLAWETWQAGMVPRLKRGESIETLASNRPSPAFMGFLEFLIRDIAVGLGLPFEFLWDLAKAKGSGSRFILAKAQRRFEQRQALFVQRMLNRVWFWAIGRAIDRKELPAVDGWWDVRWQGPAKITMDMGKEAQANRDDLKYGNRTLQQDAADQGLDWQTDIRGQKAIEVSDLLERAVALVQRFGAQGLTLDRALHLLSADSPNAPVLPVEGEEKKPKPGDDEDEGEPGAVASR